MNPFKHLQTRNSISPWDYLWSFLLLTVIASLPAFLYGKRFLQLNNSYFKWYLLYLVLVSSIFVSIVSYRKYVTFDLPIRHLNQATKKVSQGDFSVYLQPIHNDGNISDLDQMFENFNTMVAELGSAETMKNDFVANVSHEFKAPLAVIKSYASTMQEEAEAGSELAGSLQTIIDQTDKMALLVTNVLKLTKIETQAVQPNVQDYDLSRQLTDLILTFEKIWEEKQIALQVEIPDQLRLQTDPEMMVLVWQNLLSNAFKFTPMGGSVTVAAKQVDDGIEVRVKDTGPGMSEETVKKIFEKFYQGDQSHATSGNGLGLALVDRIIHLMAGTISVSSKLGQGSEFKVWLPAKKINII
ncbi:HAMP domain-containing histidine kinase [Oenococcus kitaharae]|uniref:HAMP domain-containing sensor histidine kinase n=2 Tax=Lactobacillaceae TaxID=33958 RepID=UPI0021E8D879|nr:HAMP domain-containing sensor histidine kinase [Oenococcus kitaharae]MCV3295839.1 HAMP domain-containing histidine kinase [Oenococcus kitaharae]